MNTQKGSISIFLLIIFVSLILFTGLLVDAVRILIARQKVQSALFSASRSVLADYDRELIGEFGIYGLDCRFKNEELLKYLQVNLLERNEGIRFIKYAIKDAEVVGVNEAQLLNNKTFEWQILEEMKYKAPLNAAQQVMEILNSANLGQKNELMKKGTQASQERKQLTRKLNDLNKSLRMMDMTSAFRQLAALNGLEQMSAELKNKVQKYKLAIEAANKKIAELNQEGEESYHKLSSQNENNGQDEVVLIEDGLREFEEDIRHNRAILLQIIPLENELAFFDVSKDAKDLARISEIEAQINSLYSQLRVLRFVELPSYGKLKSLSANEIELKEVLGGKLNRIWGRNIIADNPVTKLITEQEFASANPQHGAGGFLALIFSPEQKLQKSLDDQAETIGQDITSYMDDILHHIIEGRNRLYLTEYIMDKYTFVTSKTPRAHYFTKGEIEYLLCGHESEIKNIIDTFSKVWTFRFSLNTLDALLTSKAPHPVVRLAASLVEGFTLATQDMIKLYKGEGVPLLPSLKNKGLPYLKYSDHLRLLLLCEDKEQELNRMRQLMQITIRERNGEFELKNYTTMIKARTKISINLWFLPALHLDKLGISEIEGHYYWLEQEITMGY